MGHFCIRTCWIFVFLKNLFIFTLFESQWDSVHLLVYPLKVYSSWCLARQNPEAWNCRVSNKDLSTWTLICCFLGCTWAGSWVGSRAGAQSRRSDVGDGCPRWCLNFCPNQRPVPAVWFLTVGCAFLLLWDFLVFGCGTLYIKSRDWHKYE